MNIYLDNSATTALCTEAKAAMTAAMEVFGNPSSLHEVGQKSAALLRESREAVAMALGERYIKEGQLIFTGSGTEATVLALLGTAHAKERREAKTILTTDSEHPSVENNLRLLEKEGFRVIRVPTRGGALDMDGVLAHCDKQLFMVSMMLVNNETGARYPVEQVFAAAKRANPDCICHCDAVQGFLKVPMTVKNLGADLITVSAHKIHGPKGVGALYIAPHILKKRAISPILAGGGQEFGLRSGTENIIGIAGFAAAAKAGHQRVGQDVARMASLSQALIDGLAGSEIRVNLPPKRAPHIVNITLPQIKSETMLHFLSGKGISVSSGSACSSHAKNPSGTLLAFGLAAAQADCSLRVSFCPTNTEADAEALLAALDEGCKNLIRVRR
ncbi:MAG: aminotransferase class V-fold PLP-dependent enzyme [Ruminococcaceae bacterium]|nr:aminotransferase class V-fold PLP-dependent enzyme [Oscillospiraceae bacterium]